MSIPRTLAFDPGATCGIAAYVDGTFYCDTLHFTPCPEQPGQHLAEVFDVLGALMEALRPELVLLEITIYAARSAAQRLGSSRFNAMCHLAAFNAGAEVIDMHPSSWKKYGLGHGGLAKADVMEAVEARGIPAGTFDQADAIGILVGGLVRHRGFDADELFQTFAAAEAEAAKPAWDKMSEQERGALYVQDSKRFTQLRAESRQYHSK